MKKVSLIFLSTAASRVITIISQLVVANFVSPSGLGQFIFAMSVVNICSIFQASDVARLALQGDANKQKNFNEILCFVLSVTLGVLAIGTVYLTLLSSFDEKQILFFLVLGILSVFRILTNFKVAYLSGKINTRVISINSMLEGLTRNGALLALAAMGLDEFSLLGAEVLAISASLIYLYKKNNYFSTRYFGFPDKKMILLIFKVIGTSQLSTIERDFSVIVVAFFSGQALAGQFGFASRIANQLSVLILPMIAYEVIPKLLSVKNDAVARNYYEKLFENKLYIYLSFLVVSLSIGGYLSIVYFWGDKWGIAAVMLPYLLLGAAFRIWYLFQKALLEVDSRFSSILILSLGDSVLFLSFCLGFSSFFGGASIAMAVCCNSLLIFLISKKINSW